jgi:hypothetical protein
MGMAIVALHDRSFARYLPLVLMTVLGTLLLLGLPRDIGAMRTPTRLSQAVLGLGMLVTLAGTLLGVIDGQRFMHVAVGSARLAFWPVLFVVAAKQHIGELGQWISSEYVRHARYVYFIGTMVFGISAIIERWVVLPVGHGVDPILLGYSLSPARDRRGWRRQQDLALVFIFAVLSLKRGAWLALAIAIVLKAWTSYLQAIRRDTWAPWRDSIKQVIALIALVVIVFSLSSEFHALDVRMARFIDADQSLPMLSEPYRESEVEGAIGLLGTSGLAEVLMGRGSGYRFLKKDSDTGALHHTYLTGVVLGGAIWAILSLLWISSPLRRTIPAWLFTALFVSVALATKSNMLLDPFVPLLAAACHRMPVSRAGRLIDVAPESVAVLSTKRL